MAPWHGSSQISESIGLGKRLTGERGQVEQNWGVVSADATAEWGSGTGAGVVLKKESGAECDCVVRPWAEVANPAKELDVGPGFASTSPQDKRDGAGTWQTEGSDVGVCTTSIDASF